MNKEMLKNLLYNLQQDIECTHKYLDEKQVPRQDDNGKEYSIIGRIDRLEASFYKQLSELESYYLTIKSK